MFKKRTNKKKELKLDSINDKYSEEEDNKQENLSQNEEKDMYLTKRDSNFQETTDNLNLQNDQYASKKLKVGVNLNDMSDVPKANIGEDE